MSIFVFLSVKRTDVYRSSCWWNEKQTCDFPNLRGTCVWRKSLKKAAVSIRQWNGTIGMVHEGRSGLADNTVQAVFPWSIQNKAVDKDSFPRNLGFIFFLSFEDGSDLGVFGFHPTSIKWARGVRSRGLWYLPKTWSPIYNLSPPQRVHRRSVQSVNESFKPEWTGSYQTRLHCAQV